MRTGGILIEGRWQMRVAACEAIGDLGAAAAAAASALAERLVDDSLAVREALPRNAWPLRPPYRGP